MKSEQTIIPNQYGDHEITVYKFDCGCTTTYERNIETGAYCKSDEQKRCSIHNIAKETLVCPRCGYKATNLVNLDNCAGKVKISTAKQQLARHISYSHKNSEEKMFAISKKGGF